MNDLLKAVADQDTQTIRALVADGADINEFGYYQDHYTNPLILAAWIGSPTIVNVVLALGADVHANQDRALIVAAMYGYIKICHALIAKGADVHAINDRAIAQASKNQHTGTVNVLLAAGADPQAIINHKLVFSCSVGNPHYIDKWLAAGADIHAWNDEPLKVAIIQNHPEIVRKLIIDHNLHISVATHQWLRETQNDDVLDLIDEREFLTA